MSAQKKPALGRGLSAILQDKNPIFQTQSNLVKKSSISEILISDINPNPNQPRANFDPDSLQELANSIEQLGLIQPITVRYIKETQRYQLISGERRFRAAKIVKLTRIPAYIREVDDNQQMIMGLVENIQRDDLNPIEMAISFKRLLQEFGQTQEDLASKIGKQRSTIANYIRLLNLDPTIQHGLQNKVISMGHARALLSLPNFSDQVECFKIILEKELSVRQVEILVKNYTSPITKSASKTTTPSTNSFKTLANEMGSHLGIKVALKSLPNGKGQCVLFFNSDTDLQRIKQKLTS